MFTPEHHGRYAHRGGGAQMSELCFLFLLRYSKEQQLKKKTNDEFITCRQSDRKMIRVYGDHHNCGLEMLTCVLLHLYDVYFCEKCIFLQSVYLHNV